MSNSFKLVAVLDINTLILFKARGLKIIETIKRVSIHGSTNHKTEKHEGFKFQSKSQSSFYDPHSSPKDIEYIESSRKAAKEIELIISNDHSYKGLVLVGDAKTLGHIRSALNKKLKSLVLKEVQKNMIKNSIKEITTAVFN